jgi:hypothetical protein
MVQFPVFPIPAVTLNFLRNWDSVVGNLCDKQLQCRNRNYHVFTCSCLKLLLLSTLLISSTVGYYIQATYSELGLDLRLALQTCFFHQVYENFTFRRWTEFIHHCLSWNVHDYISGLNYMEKSFLTHDCCFFIGKNEVALLYD